MRRNLVLVTLLVLLAPSLARAAACVVPNTFVPGTTISSAQVNANFTTIASCVGSTDATNANNIASGLVATSHGGTNQATWTAGSVPYLSTASQFAEDNANFFWNGTNHRLGIGTTAPAFTLDVAGNGHFVAGVAIDNNAAVSWKIGAGTLLPGIYLDNLNNLQIGNTGFGQIAFSNNGALTARIDPSGNFSIIGQYQIGGTQIACGNLSNAAASCSTNTTNASNITSGTLPIGQLSGAYTGVTGVGTLTNLTVSPGNIGVDNNKLYLGKDTTGTYRGLIHIDTANNFDIGDTNIAGNICFLNSGSNCAAFVGTNATYNLPHGRVDYTGTQVQLTNSTVANTYFAAKDDGSIFISAQSGSYNCSMNFTVSPNWGCTSDARLKDWRPLLGGTKEIMALRPVAFSWKADAEKHPHIGFLAQDVEKVFPQLVGEDGNGVKNLATDGLIAPMVLAIQELTARVEALERSD